MSKIALFYYDSGESGEDGPTGMYHAPAYNALEFSGYMNGENAVAGWYQRFTDIIFSQRWIPAPLDP